MSYRQTLLRLAGASETQALAVLGSWRDGDLDDDEFRGLLAAFVAAANHKAAALADLSLSAAVTVALRRPIPPLGLLPPADDADRLHKATATLLGTLDTTPDPPARVARLARSEPLTTAARTYSEGMRASPHVTRWTRGLSGNACQLCRWWARDGRVWPADHPMPTHKGCTCSPQPVI